MKPLYTLALLLTALTASAQDLNREITVDREIVPVESDARRLPLVPEVTLPAVAPVKLTPTERAVTTTVPPTVRLLDPAEWADPLAPPHTRGYVAGGLGGPAFNGALSAGYRLIDTPVTSLAAWLQWDSRVYSRHDLWWRTHAGALGADFARRFGANSLLESSLSWNIGRFNMPRAPQSWWQTSNRVDFSAAWHSRTSGLTYDIDARYGHFGYAKPGPAFAGTPEGAVRQNRFGIGADGWLYTSETSQAGLRVDLDMLSTAARTGHGGKTTGVLTLTPGWRLHSDVWHLELAPRIDLTFNGDKVFHIAPDVRLGCTPSAFFAAEVRLGGGERFNSLASLAQTAPRQLPCMAYGLSHLPLTVDADITVGPWRGAWLRLFGGWARANSWLMPQASPDAMYWQPEDIRGGHLGVELGAKAGTLLEAKARYTGAAGGDLGKGYYLWADRARHVVDAELTVRPLRRLDISVAYELCACRTIYAGELANRLGNLSRLRLGARYALTPRLSLWVDADNLLNRSNTSVDLTTAQGANAMAGASLKF